MADILALRPVLIRRGLHLRVESGLLSGIDLASDDPGTKMMVNVLAAVLEFQRDMISENTREGVAVAEAAGKTLGRPASLDPDQAAKVVEAFGEGTAVKALARQHQVDPKAIRRVLDDHLLASGDETVRTALASGRTIRRGQGHSLRITAPLELHRTALQQAVALATESSSSAERKAHRVYATRITAAT
ncbi:recombinase family protein [Streptomyces sp. SID685]|uniref:recombinase family protein n=1 Tax=Streptomyces sp. SID685 TaxID=2690322 RepID=UPI00136BEB47|nr:recombinase family protein [Streptomyces sp. SID685]